MTSNWFYELIDRSHSVDVRDGLWHFHPQDEGAFFAEYLPSIFLEQLECAKDVGWQVAVERGLSLLEHHVAEYTRDYFFSSYRSDFIEELAIQPRSTVLDIGCGWGSASQRCLEKGANVVGADNAVRRLEFCLLRFRQQGFTDNFVAIELDANRIFPFKPNTFDSVIISGLVEWLPSTKMGDPEFIQRSFLEKCVALLKAEGRMYLAIENRTWGRYFVGAKDLHTKQRFVSILPRRIARSYSMLTSGLDYRVYTYSLLHYITLFRKMGFRVLHVIYPEPDYVQPKRTSRILSSLALQQTDFKLMLSIIRQKPSWRHALFGQSFMFIAVK